MENTTSTVIWSSRSFRWSIRNFTDIFGKTSESKSNALPRNEEEDWAEGFQEYQCLIDIDFIQSPTIYVGHQNGGGQSQWLVKLMKSTEEENCADVHLEFLEMERDANDSGKGATVGFCFFKYKVEILGSNGESFLKRDTDKIIFLKGGTSWCEPAMIQVDSLYKHAKEVLKDDTLNLKIDIFVLSDLHHARSDGTSKIPSDHCSLPGKMKKSNRNNDYQEILDSYQLELAKQVLNKLWETRMDSDATVRCADVEFLVHKFVLSSSPKIQYHVLSLLVFNFDQPLVCYKFSGASPVFLAAFSHDMSENNKSQIEITDISPTIVEALLRFIYCVTNLDEPQWKTVDHLTQMLNAAEKYQIVTLKSLVFSKLCEELDLNNAGLITSLLYLFEPEEKVKNFVYKYVLSNINLLKGVSSFKNKLIEMPAAFTPILLMIDKVSLS